MRISILMLALLGVVLSGGCGPSGKTLDVPGPGSEKPAAETIKSTPRTLTPSASSPTSVDDTQLFQGKVWEVAEGEVKGFLTKGTRITFQPDGKVKLDSATAEPGSYVLGVSHSPKEIDLTLEGKTKKGVYEIVPGETPQVKVTFALNASASRPTKVEDPFMASTIDEAKKRATEIAYVVLAPVAKQ